MRGVRRFDVAVLEKLQEIKGLAVYESMRPEGARDRGAYVVFFGLDIISGAAREYRPITGIRKSAVIHPFSIQVVAPTVGIRNDIVDAVRDKLLGVVLDGASEIEETGLAVSHGDHDASISPVRFTYMLTFKVTWDLGD